MDLGMHLEDSCIGYLRRTRGCKEFYYHDANVRYKLGLPKDAPCADILALHQYEASGPITEITIAEAKAAGSADPDQIARQLGNAAAGALAFFPHHPQTQRPPKLNLLVWTDRLVWDQDAIKYTASIKIVAKRILWPDGVLRPTLCEISANAILRPAVTLSTGPHAVAARLVTSLLIEIVLTEALASKATA